MCYKRDMNKNFVLRSTVSLGAMLYGAIAFAQTAPGPTVQLDTITVEGQGEKAAGPVTGYVATRSATGSKSNTPITAIRNPSRSSAATSSTTARP